MPNYVLMRDGRILPQVQEEKAVPRHRKRIRGFHYQQEVERLRREVKNYGQKPFRNLREANDARQEMAAVLGGAGGFVKAAEIKVFKLVPYRPKARRTISVVEAPPKVRSYRRRLLTSTSKPASRAMRTVPV